MIKIKIPPGLKFLSEENGKPCHKHILNGEEVPGCTSISSLFQDDGWKFAWPPKLMEEMLLKDAEDSRKIEGDRISWDFESFKNRLKEAKNAWRQKRDKAADSGTIAHKIIGAHLFEIPISIENENPEVRHCYLEFIEWEKKYKPQWLASEVQVGSEKYKFAGILDALANVEGKLTLVDFKTSSDIKDDYIIQLAGLAIALEECGVTVEQRAILHLPKDPDEPYEYRIIDTDLTKDKLAFLVALEFYRHKNIFNARCKNEKRRTGASNRGSGRKNTVSDSGLIDSPGGAISNEKGTNGNVGERKKSEVQSI